MKRQYLEEQYIVTTVRLFWTCQKTLGSARRARIADQPGKGVDEFKKMLVETFHDYCESSLYALKYNLLHHMTDNIKRFGTPSVLDSSAYEHLNLLIKKASRRTLHRTRAGVLVTVNVIIETTRGRRHTKMRLLSGS